jgi:hypothetical protein
MPVTGVRDEAVLAGGELGGGLLLTNPVRGVARLALEPGGLSAGPAGRTGEPPLPAGAGVVSRAAGLVDGGAPTPLAIVALGRLVPGFVATLLS